MKTKISLHHLFQTLLSPISTREYEALPEEDIVPTTIRLEPDVRRYYEDVAKELGISLQAIIKISLAGLMKVSQHEAKTKLNLVLDRFFEIFSAHQVQTVDIPTFLLPYRIPLSSLAHHDRLLDMIDSRLLEHISTLFNVNLSWLQGSDNSPIKTTRLWYKFPNEFCHRLNEFAQKNLKPEVIFVSDASTIKMNEDRIHKNEEKSSRVGIMLKFSAKTESEMPYEYFEVYEYGSWAYEQARLDLKTIMLFCARHNFNMKGMVINKSDFSNLFYGNALPITIYNKRNSLSTQRWEPDNYILAGFTCDQETDELLKVIHYYCVTQKTKEKCDHPDDSVLANCTNRARLNLNLYDPTKSLLDLLNDQEKQYLISKQKSVLA